MLSNAPAGEVKLAPVGPAGYNYVNNHLLESLTKLYQAWRRQAELIDEPRSHARDLATQTLRRPDYSARKASTGSTVAVRHGRP